MASQSHFGRVDFQDIGRYAVIFLILFLIGIMGGRTVGMNVYSNTLDEPEFVVTQVRGNGQRNLIILSVDQLSSPQPSLESIWLLVTYPGTPILTLVPIYPNPQEDAFHEINMPWRMLQQC